MQINVLSLQDVLWPVPATKLGASFDPTADVVRLAFKPVGVAPVSGDFVTGFWETWANGVHYAGVLIGPGGTIALQLGSYTVFVKVTDSPEIPVMQAPGTLDVVQF